MRHEPGLIGVACAAMLLGTASLAQASPIGTPAANRVPTGNGHAFGHMFDDLVDPHGDDHANNSDPQAPHLRKHYTASEWRAAYIARHHHDLPLLKHPGN